MATEPQKTPDKAKAQGDSKTAARPAAAPRDPFVRAPGEDDDGYDPYSDRPAAPAAALERDPWN